MKKKNNNVTTNNFQKIFKKIKKYFQKVSEKYQRTYEQIQLTFIYFFATVVLMFLIQTSIGYFPDILYTIVPFSKEILSIKLLGIFTSPEKTFVLYLLIIEIIINRPILKFSILVKFNILLIFLLEMLQNLVINWWDVLFTRELDIFHGEAYFNRSATIQFLTILFSFFYLLYVISYIAAMRGRFPVFPGILQKVVDSVAFWLQIKKIDPSENKDKD
jgi:hypothetical protein